MQTGCYTRYCRYGIQKMKTVMATLKGYEVMYMFENKQFNFWIGVPETKLERL